MRSLFFVINSIQDFTFGNLIDQYLPEVKVSVGEVLPFHNEQYDMIVLWNYKKIIKEIPENNNIVILHASDLPKGKGWAPIYNSIVRNEPFYIVTAIKLAKEADAGNILAQGKFAIKDSYTASFIRSVSERLELQIIAKILDQGHIIDKTGMIQRLEGESFYPRRYPKDNSVSLDSKLIDIFDHLRACEESHPAFVDYHGIKYNIFAIPQQTPEFPKDIEIVLQDDNKKIKHKEERPK